MLKGGIWCVAFILDVNALVFFLPAETWEYAIVKFSIIISSGILESSFSCGVQIVFFFPFARQNSGLALRVMLGFAVDSIEHFLVKGISFPSSKMFMCCLVVIAVSVDHKKAGESKEHSDTAQCLLLRHRLTLVSKEGKLHPSRNVWLIRLLIFLYLPQVSESTWKTYLILTSWVSSLGQSCRKSSVLSKPVEVPWTMERVLVPVI